MPALRNLLGRASFPFDWLPSGLSLRVEDRTVSLSFDKLRTVSLPNRRTRSLPWADVFDMYGR